MNRNRILKTDLGNEIILRTRCSRCNIDYFDKIKKNGRKKEGYNYLCEECKKDIKKYLREHKLKMY